MQLDLDPEKHSRHSFKRGGATLAFQHHIDPAVIKKHGRWKSEAYLLYVDLSAIFHSSLSLFNNHFYSIYTIIFFSFSHHHYKYTVLPYIKLMQFPL